MSTAGPTRRPDGETMADCAQAMAFCMSSGRLSAKYSICWRDGHDTYGFRSAFWMTTMRLLAKYSIWWRDGHARMGLEVHLG